MSIMFWAFNAVFVVMLGAMYGELEFDWDRFNEDKA